MNKELILELNKLKKKLFINENLNKTFKNIYLKLAEIIFLNKISLNKPIILGLSGAQGSGKSTCVQFLKLILEKKYNLKTAVVSIDDVYKTKKERIIISKKVNKLFLVRGVPGTHDINYLINFFKHFKKSDNNIYLIPKFDKLLDDRSLKESWYKIKTNIDVFILEGWCVGARPENSIQNLKKPINKLESLEDKKCLWRKKVNEHLNKDYKYLFSYIDLMIYLKIPNFKKVLDWRILQENKIKYSVKKRSIELKIMTDNQIKRFIMFYERITKKMLIDMPKFADIIIPIKSNHQPKKIIVN
jgi:D-glycerate 3-kinase